MREIITIHIGQAGIQLGSSFWELLCLEHGIQPDGFIPSGSFGTGDDCFMRFFSEDWTSGKFTAKSVFIDLEPDVIDQLKTGTYREIFPVDHMIFGKEDTGQNFARGYGDAGKQYIDTCLDRIRKVADGCSGLHGFIIFNSVGGGTGSGLGSLLIERLSVDYGSKSKLSIPIYPSANSRRSMLEPHNIMLATKYQMDHITMATLMENDALSNICTKHLQIEKPEYGNLNSVAAHMISSITTGLRYHSALNVDSIDIEIEAGLVPFSAPHFTFASYAPFVAEGSHTKQMNTLDLVKSLLSPDFMSVKCDPDQGKYMAIRNQYQGDFLPKDINQAVSDIKRNNRIGFVDWCPLGWKCQMNCCQPVVAPGSKIRAEKRVASLLANSSAISQVFSRNAEEFDEIYKKKELLHLYLSEGMEEDEFLESRERLTQLLMHYRDVERENNDEIEETPLIGTGA